jgi:ABC-2 type transport system ATP-binding protein
MTEMALSDTAPPPEGPGPAVVGLSCHGLSSGYLGRPVLHDISFTIDRPAVYVVLGPNGAGKTTLFRTLAGILRPYAGEVRIGGDPVERRGARDRLHYLSHVDGMPDGLRVREALEFYARAEGADRSAVDRVLARLEIAEWGDRYLSELSSGQKKRVSIARVFLQDRGIYLLDEPTTSLDPKAAREIRSVILGLSREKVVLYSSHNLFEAREIGDYVLAIKDGRLALFDRLENLRSSHFVIGVRTLEPAAALAGWRHEGDYYLTELSGPEAVPDLLGELEGKGVKIRELREMENPLEDLFA